jgi:hypothetical protein
MYKTNRIGPWPVVDLAMIVNEEASASLTMTGIEDFALDTYLEAENLGSGKECQSNICFTSTNSLGAGDCLPVGMAMIPPSSIHDQMQNFIIEFSGVACIPNEADIVSVPFVGVIDNALTPTAGQHATNNVLKNHILLPDMTNFASGCSWNLNIVIDDLVGSFDRDDYIVCGYQIMNLGSSSQSLYFVRSSMQCRYNLSSIPLFERS